MRIKPPAQRCFRRRLPFGKMENAFTMNNSAKGRSIVNCLRAKLPLELLLTVALNLVVWTPYLTLQRIHFFPATTMPMSFLDQAIPFSSAAVWAYLSVYLLLPIGPFLMVDRAQILRYSRGVATMTIIATAVFIFFPTTCSRPDPAS